MGIRKQFSSEFKAKVALEALKGQKTIAELSSEFGVHATRITAWRNQLKGQAAEVFGNAHDESLKSQKELIDQLYKNIGQLQVEVDWFKKKFTA